MLIETCISFFADRWPHHIAGDLEEIQGSGISDAVHTLMENDLIPPR